MGARRIEFLDFARGYSILTIVLYHLLQVESLGIWSSLARFGSAGVHAFVFLSGTGLTISALRSGMDGFYRRRFLNILIPYFIFVTGVYLANLKFGVYSGDSGSFYAYLGHIFLFKMFDESIIGSLGYHLWFMSTIFQLYFAFPLMFRLLLRWGESRLLLVSCLISLCFTALIVIVGVAQYRVWNSCGIVFLWEFALGMWAAKRFVDRDVRFWETPWLALSSIVMIGGMLLLMLVRAEQVTEAKVSLELVNNPIVFATYIALMVAIYRISKASALQFLNRFILFVNGFAYELYLTHGLVVASLLRAELPNGRLLALAYLTLALGGALCVGLAFQRLLVLIYAKGLGRAV